MANNLIKVFVKNRPRKQPGPYFLTAFGMTYHLIPNLEKPIEIDEKVVEAFGQYFLRVKEVTANSPEVFSVDTGNMTKDDAENYLHKLANNKETEKIVLDLEIDVDENKKANGLSDYLEMKKAVAAMGINTHGLKKPELEKILKKRNKDLTKK